MQEFNIMMGILNNMKVIFTTAFNYTVFIEELLTGNFKSQQRQNFHFVKRNNLSSLEEIGKTALK